MKIVVIGDIHGRSCWKDIIDIEKDYDLLIFLGDYVSTHEDITPEEQINNLKEILKYKEDNADKVVLLRGNHDMQHLGYSWARCSGLFTDIEEKMNYKKSLGKRFLKDTQWIYYDESNNILYSHAGLTNTWFKSCKVKNINDINDLKPGVLFGFISNNPWDYYGDSVTQPITWVRPTALTEDYYNKEGLTQIVGHTTYHKIMHNFDNCNLWICDCLPSEYLVVNITDKPEFIIKPLHKEFSFTNRYGAIVKLINTEDNKYKLYISNGYENYTRVIMDNNDRSIDAVDPPGGPYLSIGTEIGDFIISKIELIGGEFIIELTENEEI